MNQDEYISSRLINDGEPSKRYALFIQQATSEIYVLSTVRFVVCYETRLIYSENKQNIVLGVCTNTKT